MDRERNEVALLLGRWFLAFVVLAVLTGVENGLVHRTGFFPAEEIVPATAAKVLRSLNERSWIRVRVPSTFRDGVPEFLRQHRLWQVVEGVDANWVYPDGTCEEEASRPVGDANLRPGDEFWFASGYPAPDRASKPILPPTCDQG